MDDKVFDKLFKAADSEVGPPDGLKDKLYRRVIGLECDQEYAFSALEKFFFETPLKAACVIAVPVSAVLWIVLGEGLAELISSVIR